jgi:protein-disulfide isomerase
VRPSELEIRMPIRAVTLVLAGLLAAALVHADRVGAAPPLGSGESMADYLARHPEAIEDALGRYESSEAAAAAAKQKAAIKANAAILFNSTRQVTLGNPKGDVTVVEFFDYNCGFCKRALSDLLDLIKQDAKVKVVLKELPVLGPDSVAAARVAVAVHLQDPGGAKYLAFHQQLLGSRGRIDQARALATAAGLGLDMARLGRDMASAEATATLDEVRKLARQLGINGTPSYVIGDTVVIGAVGLRALTAEVAALRK